MENIRTKRVTGFVAAGIFVLWLIVDVVRLNMMIMELYPYGNLFEWIGIAYSSFLVSVVALVIAVAVLAIVGSTKMKLNISVPIILGIVWMAYLADCVNGSETMLWYMKSVLENTDLFSLLTFLRFVIIYVIKPICLILFVVMAIVAAAGKRFMKGVWFLPAILLGMTVIIDGALVICIPGIAFSSLMSKGLYVIAGVIFTVALGFLSCWMALHMPEKVKPIKQVNNATVGVGANQPIYSHNQMPQSPLDENYDVQLRKYKQLLDDGIITQDDFDKKKNEILNL